MRLYLLRHAETEANIARTCQGHQDGKLTAQGEWQAARVAERLKDITFDLIIVSDLGRTKETAAPIIATHPEADVIYEPRVRERHQGVFEGKPYGTFTTAAQEAGIPIISFKPEGGESIIEARERACAFIDGIISKHKGKSVLIISHGGVMTQMLFHLMRKEDNKDNYEHLHPKNTALSLFHIKDDGKHEARLLNCTEHL